MLTNIQSVFFYFRWRSHLVCGDPGVAGKGNGACCCSRHIIAITRQHDPQSCSYIFFFFFRSKRYGGAEGRCGCWLHLFTFCQQRPGMKSKVTSFTPLARFCCGTRCLLRFISRCWKTPRRDSWRHAGREILLDDIDLFKSSVRACMGAAWGAGGCRR